MRSHARSLSPARLPPEQGIDPHERERLLVIRKCINSGYCGGFVGELERLVPSFLFDRDSCGHAITCESQMGLRADRSNDRFLPYYDALGRQPKCGRKFRFGFGKALQQIPERAACLTEGGLGQRPRTPSDVQTGARRFQRIVEKPPSRLCVKQFFYGSRRQIGTIATPCQRISGSGKPVAPLPAILASEHYLPAESMLRLRAQRHRRIALFR